MKRKLVSVEEIPVPASVPPQPEAVLADVEQSRRFERMWQSWGRRAAAGAVMLGAAAGVGAAIEGYTPSPDVSSAGTEALISANNALRDGGPYVLGGGLALGAAMGGAYVLSSRKREQFAFTRNTEKKGARNLAGKILPPFVISAAAVGTGIGATAGEGANAPVNFLAEATGATHGPAAIVLQHDNVTPFNSSEVTKKDIAQVQDLVGSWQLKDGTRVTVTPFDLRLGELQNPNKSTNPSSSPIVALPQANLARMTSTNFGEADGLQVMVGSQLAKNGNTVQVEGVEATVAKTIPMRAGLDRVATIGTLEDMEGTIFKSQDVYYGAVVNGITAEQLDAALQVRGIDVGVESFEEFQQKYDKFWERSVDPPEMELILFLAFAGAIATSYMRVTEVMSRQKNLAVDNVLGVDKKVFNRAEDLRAVSNSIKALGGAALIGVPALTYITNSSQYGVGQAVDAKGLGAGLTILLATNLISNVAAKRMNNQLDSATELRG